MLRMSDDAALREQLAKLRVPFEMDRRAPVDPARPERLDAVKRWYAQDCLTIDASCAPASSRASASSSRSARTTRRATRRCSR
jgi:hypothetical protein